MERIEKIKNLQSLYLNVHNLKYLNLTEQQKETIRDNIKFLFGALDNYKISFKIQNSVMQLAENKNNIHKYFNSLLKENNIIID